jgi:hypothetical protein
LVAYRATLDLPGELVSFVENVIATRSGELCSPRRALTSFDQAVLALVWLRDGDTFEQLGLHFGISTDMAWRYATETMRALAAHGPTLAEALREAGPERRMILDGTLIPTWRCATRPAGHDGDNQDPYYSGKHHRPGMNAQALVGMDGEPAFVGQARCGSTHDLAAAREDGIIDAAAETGVEILADSGYQGAGGHRAHPGQAPQTPGPQRTRVASQHAARRQARARQTRLRSAQRLARVATGTYQPESSNRPAPSRPRGQPAAIFTRPSVDRKSSLRSVSTC